MSIASVFEVDAVRVTMMPASELELLPGGSRVTAGGIAPIRVSRVVKGVLSHWMKWTLCVLQVGFRYFRLKRLRESLLPPSASPSGDSLSSNLCSVSLVLPSCIAEKYSHVNPHFFDVNPKAAKFFVCKSDCEENVYIALR